MGQRGPQALPANVHLLRGNPSKKSFDALLDEFKPEVEIPGYPSWIGLEAKKEWKRVTVELEKYGLISKIDRAVLVVYCRAWASYVWHETMLDRAKAKAIVDEGQAMQAGKLYEGGDGTMVRTTNGNLTYSHHWVMSKSAAQQIKHFADLFGMSPWARSRVTQSDNRQSALFEEGSQDQWSAI